MFRSLASLGGIHVLLVLALAACGGSGSDAAPPTENLTGFWQLFLTPTGSPTENGPSAIYLSQNGATIAGAGTIGTMSGAAFSMTSNGGSFVAAFNGTATATTANGTVTFTGGGLNASGTFRLARFTPAGTLSVSGMIGSNSIDITTTSGYGSRDYSDPALTMLAEVEIGAANVDAQLEIDFSPGGLTVGALNVPGDVTALVLYRSGATIVEVETTSGTLTVTQYDSNGFAGSFSLTLDGGGTITGSFDVSFDLESFDG